MSELCPPLADEVVALDDKTVRGLHGGRCGNSLIHIVSVFVCGQSITLGPWTTEERSNEITALPQLIEVLDLNSATVPLDAMGCQ